MSPATPSTQRTATLSTQSTATPSTQSTQLFGYGRRYAVWLEYHIASLKTGHALKIVSECNMSVGMFVARKKEIGSVILLLLISRKPNLTPRNDTYGLTSDFLQTNTCYSESSRIHWDNTTLRRSREWIAVCFPIAHGMNTPLPKLNTCFTICFLELSYVDLGVAVLLQFVLMMQTAPFDVQFEKTIISETSPIHCHIPSSVLSIFSLPLCFLVLQRLKYITRNIFTCFTKLMFGKFPKNYIQHL